MDLRRALPLAAALCAACSTQRWPPPMDTSADPLPPGEGADVLPGIEEVVVVRHADPVMLRPNGRSGAYPMRFWAKRERVRAGAWVTTGAGGRAELLWPGERLSVVLFDEGAALVGERSRDEPAVRLEKITRARILLVPDARVRLEGGCEILGDAEDDSGPYLIEKLDLERLRLRNQSKRTVRVEYREELILVGPGQSVELPILGIGADPIDPAPDEALFAEAAPTVGLRGDAHLLSDERGWLFEADGPARLRGLGVEVRLEAGERVRFAPLRDRPAVYDLPPDAVEPEDDEVGPFPPPAPLPPGPTDT